jgi:hypothetical protein
VYREQFEQLLSHLDTASHPRTVRFAGPLSPFVPLLNWCGPAGINACARNHSVQTFKAETSVLKNASSEIDSGTLGELSEGI